MFVVSLILLDGRGQREGLGSHIGGTVAGSHAGPIAVDERPCRGRGGTSQDIHLPLHQVRFGSGEDKIECM